MSEYIFDVPDSNQPIAGDTSLYYPDERDEPMMVRGEIVRCRDCRLQDEIKYCDRSGFEVGDNDFCAWYIKRDADTQSTSKKRAIEGVLMYLIDSSNTVEFDAMTAIEKAVRDIMEIMGGES